VPIVSAHFCEKVDFNPRVKERVIEDSGPGLPRPAAARITGAFFQTRSPCSSRADNIKTDTMREKLQCSRVRRVTPNRGKKSGVAVQRINLREGEF